MNDEVKGKAHCIYVRPQDAATWAEAAEQLAATGDRRSLSGLIADLLRAWLKGVK